VLVVDDNCDVRDALRMMLESEGLSVETAADGEEALQRMRESPPAVVLLDLNMPHLDAYGFREQQRRDPELMKVPVLLYSGAADVEEAAAALGIQAWFAKPFDLDRILTLLERYVALA
jgi:chemosensory pili system protein ChpA (sensor histidine kinase/response regulator)